MSCSPVVWRSSSRVSSASISVSGSVSVGNGIAAILRLGPLPVTRITSPPVTLDPRTPTLVGGGRIVHRAEAVEDAGEPVGVDGRRRSVPRQPTPDSAGAAVDSVRVVSSLSWRYRDPALVRRGTARARRREPASRTEGGNSPQRLVNQTARELRAGRLDVAVLAAARLADPHTGTQVPAPASTGRRRPERYRPVMLGDDARMTPSRRRRSAA